MNPYKTVVTPQELKWYRELGLKSSVPSIWASPPKTGFAYMAPRGSFWVSP